MPKPHKPRFIGDINPDIDDYDSEYVRIAQWLDNFMPSEPITTYEVKLSDSQRATYESVEVIKKLIDQGKKDYVVRKTAEKIVQYIPSAFFVKRVVVTVCFNNDLRRKK